MYELTGKGRRTLEEESQAWREFSESVNVVLEGGQ